MRAACQAADDRRADGEALGDELEDRWTGFDIPVDQGCLGSAVAARRAPAVDQTGVPGPCAIEPADAGHVRRAWITAEEEWDVGNTDRKSTRLNHSHITIS